MTLRRWLGTHLAYLLLIPAFGVIIGLGVIPSTYSVYLSFTKFNIWLNLHPLFSGLFQYGYLLYHDPYFPQTILVSIEWFVALVGFGYPLALGLALLLNTQNLRGRTFFRVALVASYAVPITGIWPIWNRILSPTGLLDRALENLGLMSANHAVAWVDAYPLIVTATISQWNTFAFGMLTILAALQSVPRAEYEAAKLDGAGRLGVFRFVEWPHLLPLNAILWMLGIVSSLNTFNVIYVLTGGGPGFATTTIYLYAYRQLIAGDYAYTATIATLLFAFEIVLGFFYVKYIWMRQRQ
jgi:ABC-type sugar transport system permease subunit